MRMTLEGLRAPDLVGGPEDWINSEPLQFSDFPGKAILLDIFDYTCVNCLRTIPYVKEWHERYKNFGLVVIGIHAPEFDFASSRGNVERAVKQLEIAYPVVMDNDYINWSNYANRFWPRKILIDETRRIVHDRIGEGGYGEFESVIQQVVHRLNPGAPMPPLMEPIRPEDREGARCYKATPETYAGYRRGSLGNAEGYHLGKTVNYTDPGEHEDGKIYLRGTWSATNEALIHARRTELPEDYLALQFHAAGLNAVIRPEREGAEFDVFVTLDDEPLPPDRAGDDIRYNHEGFAYIHVDFPRMYSIMDSDKFEPHEIRLATTSDAFGIYAFTFGSCEKPRKQKKVG